jgi:Ca2+-binding RTX toxin-like protein
VKRRLLLALLLPALLWATPADAAAPLCWGKKPTKVGTPGNDVIYGNDSTNVIHGMGGNDIIKGRGGADRVCGGDGYDEVYGDKGNDLVGGDAENDSVFGGVGDDRVHGGSSFEGNYYEGGPGNDILTATSRYDLVSYRNAAGAVSINLGLGRVTGEGTDTLKGGFLNVRGSAFGDSITGSSGDDWLDGRQGPDTLRGLDGWDSLFDNGPQRDFLIGGYGSDYLDATDGSDVMDDVDAGPEAADDNDQCFGDEADVFTDACDNQ